MIKEQNCNDLQEIITQALDQIKAEQGASRVVSRSPFDPASLTKMRRNPLSYSHTFKKSVILDLISTG